jgi:ribosomal protein S18 acetylase RimI-like enzyme
MTILRDEPLTARELNELLATNNWNIPDEAKLQRAIDTSWCRLTARDDSGLLVGFVQVLSDGIRHAYILRLIVHSDCRKQGVGTRIMTELMRIIRENNMLPSLVATPGNAGFYEKFGFAGEMKNMKALCIR